MKKILSVLVAASFAMSAHSDLVAKDQSGAEMRLMESKCSHGETLGRLKEEYRPIFKNARLIVGKDFFYGCWIEQDGVAIVMLEDGTFIPVPMDAFKDPTI